MSPPALGHTDRRGAPLFFEGQPQLPVGDDGNINFVFGSQAPGGLDPSEFPSGPMDTGFKLAVFVVGGGALVGACYWLFRKLFPPPPDDPTAPKGLLEGSTTGATPTDDHHH